MIRDLSESLRALLADPTLATVAPELAAAQIAFDRPAEGFAPAQSTIDLFLYELRENTELRSNEPQLTRRDHDVEIRRPPLRVACSYLVTAWPVGGAELALQEHRLLSQALQVLAAHPTIPPAFLRGSLAGQEPPLPMMTARADGVKEPYEFWSAIGNRMRPALTVTATVALDVATAFTARQVAGASIRIGLRTATGEALVPDAATTLVWFGGRVTTTAGVPVADAVVDLVELGREARTDAEGRYRIGAVASGSYTLRVQKGPALKTAAVVVPPAPGQGYDVAL